MTFVVRSIFFPLQVIMKLEMDEGTLCDSYWSLNPWTAFVMAI